jgi:hypothetical protein
LVTVEDVLISSSKGVSTNTICNMLVTKKKNDKIYVYMTIQSI